MRREAPFDSKLVCVCVDIQRGEDKERSSTRKRTSTIAFSNKLNFKRLVWNTSTSRNRIMSDDIPPAKQHRCIDSGCEHEKYFVDIFSYVQPGQEGRNWSRKQVFLYIARAVESRAAFLQEEQTRLGMIKVHSDRFCWSKETQAGMLFAQLEMGDFQAVKRVERRKIDQMKLPEKLTYTLPPCDASSMKIVARLLSDGQESLLETEQFNVNLSLIPQSETKQGVEHECRINQPTENDS